METAVQVAMDLTTGPLAQTTEIRKDVLEPQPPDSETTKAYLRNAHPLGVSGLDYSDRWVYEEFLPQLRFPQACKVYQEMSDNDATISAVIYMIEQLVMRAGWKVVPGGDSQADLDKAKFLEECMDDMEESWNDFIQEVLSMFVYGFSFHEIIYKRRQGRKSNKKLSSKYNDNRIGWRKIPGRAQSTLFGWEFDEEGDATAFIQQAPPEFKTITIPFSRGLLFRTKHTRNNPEGRSLLRGAYRSWYFKKRMEEIEGVGVERDLAGLPVLTAPEGVDIWSKTPEAETKLAMATSIVTRIRKDRANGIVLPPGWQLDLLSAGSSKQLNTTEIINRWDQRIAITLLSDIVMLGADKVGSFALADVKKSLLSASIEAQLSRIADVLNNDAVPTLMSFNTFPETEKEPQLVPGEVETPDIKELAAALKSVNLDIFASLEIANAFLDMLSLPKLTETEWQNLCDRQEKQKEVKISGMSRENPKGDGSSDPKQDPAKEDKSNGPNESK